MAFKPVAIGRNTRRRASAALNERERCGRAFVSPTISVWRCCGLRNILLDRTTQPGSRRFKSREADRINIGPVTWSRCASRSWALQAHPAARPRAFENEDLPSGDDFVAATTVALVVERMP